MVKTLAKYNYITITYIIYNYITITYNYKVITILLFISDTYIFKLYNIIFVQ